MKFQNLMKNKKSYIDFYSDVILPNHGYSLFGQAWQVFMNRDPLDLCLKLFKKKISKKIFF